MIKRLFIDVETTGTDEKINGIHQISGVIEIDGKIKESFDYKIRPFEGAIIEPKAIEVSNVTEEQIKNNPLSEKEAYNLLSGLMLKYVQKFDKKDKFFFVGYNAHFDKNFMSEFWLRQNDKYFFSLVWGNIIDVMVLATEKLEHVRHEMINFKLMTVADKFGIKLDENKLHDASYDIEITRDLYYLLKNNNIKKEETTVTEISTDFIKAQYNSVNNNQFNSNETIISSKDYIFTFGKFSGQSLDYVLKTDKSYLSWIVRDNVKNLKFSEEILSEINSSNAKYKTQKVEATPIPVPDYNNTSTIVDDSYLNNPDDDLPF